MRSASNIYPRRYPRHVAYVGWYTWLIRTPANLSVTPRSSNERSQCSETCQFRVRTPTLDPKLPIFCFCSAAAALRTPGNFMALGLRL